MIKKVENIDEINKWIKNFHHRLCSHRSIINTLNYKYDSILREHMELINDLSTFKDKFERSFQHFNILKTYFENNVEVRLDYIQNLYSELKELNYFFIKLTQRGILKIKGLDFNPRLIPQAVRYEVFRRDGYTCRKCGAKGQRAGGNVMLHIDHIIPIKFGGSGDTTNLQTLCDLCNMKKGSKIMEVR